jgi:hypothetical protein
LNNITNANIKRAIDCVSWGNNCFVKYWSDGSVVANPVFGPVWHLYELHDLAPTYFIGNIIFAVGDDVPEEVQAAWFPIEGTKETKRKAYVSLMEQGVRYFI